MAIEVTVSNLSELENALAQSNGGETIKLLDGYYGSIDISKDFTSKVTIEAINPHKVTFNDIDIPGGSNIHLDGLVINDEPRIDQNAHHVTISNSILKNALYFRDVDNIVLDNNDIGGGYNTLTLNDVTNFTVTNNYIHHAQSDIVRITGTSKYGLFENNTVFDVAAVKPDHPDLVQMIGTSEGNPSDIIFRGNHLYDDPTTGDTYGQGFFFNNPSNGGYKNILVEDNLINVGSPNSIFIKGGQENVVIKNNTLIPWPGDGGAMIRVVDEGSYDNSGTTVYDNVAKLIVNQSPAADIGNNYFYGRDADLGSLFNGDGDHWQDFVPVDGSPIDLSTGLGASDRLTDLLNDSSSSGSTPTPDEPDTVPIDNTGSGSGDAEQPTPAPENDTGGTDQGQIDPSSSGETYAVWGEHEFNSASDVIEVAHSSNLALDAATISFSFNADTVSGTHGLISKDASYYTGGGNHLTSYIQDGNLIVRFQDGAKDEVARVGGIKADTDYDLQISFGDGNVSVWLNGEQLHSADFSTSWTTNVEYLQFGALGWSSKSGEAGFSNVFDGTISDIIVVEGNLTPAQLLNQLSDASSTSGTSGGTPTPEAPPPSAATNLLVNGDFEDNPLNNSGWGLFSAIPGWTALTGQVEVQESTYAAGNAAGDGVLELDASSNSTIAQTVAITSAGQYALSFDYIMRGTDVATNGFEVLIDGVGQGIISPTDPVWQDYSLTFNLATGSHQIAIAARGTSDGIGTYIDDVALTALDHSGTSGGTPTPEAPQNETGANVVYEQTAEQTFNGRKDSIVNLEHDAAYEVQEGTIAFTFNADDLNGNQGLFSKDASYYAGGGNHISATLKGDQLYLRFQDEDSDAFFYARGIEAGEDYDVRAWFGDGEVGLAVNGELIGIKEFEVDLSLNQQNLQFGGLGWGSSDGGDKISNAFDGTISDIMILDQAVPIDNGDLIA